MNVISHHERHQPETQTALKAHPHPSIERAKNPCRDSHSSRFCSQPYTLAIRLPLPTQSVKALPANTSALATSHTQSVTNQQLSNKHTSAANSAECRSPAYSPQQKTARYARNCARRRSLDSPTRAKIPYGSGLPTTAYNGAPFHAR